VKEGSAGGGWSSRVRRLRQALVVAEVALAAVLLVGAGLLLQSFVRITRVDPGFESGGILTARVTLHGRGYDEDERVMAFFRNVVDRARHLPGVQSAGDVSFLPLAGLAAATDFRIAGRPEPSAGQEPTTEVRVCDNGYFQAMHIPVRSGRLFEEREMRVKSDVVVVSESFARKYFPKGDAIGQRVAIDMMDDPPPTEIVGIVGDLKHESLTSEPRPTAYWPHPELVYSAMSFVLRTDGDPQLLVRPLEEAVRGVDKDQPLAEVRTMAQWVDASLVRSRFNAMLLAVFAGLALTLAAIGIYGVMSQAVGQRRPEIGIRMALGASNESIRKMVVAGGARLVLFGLAVGIPSALALTRFLSSLLYETSGKDPSTIAAVIGVLGAVALAASYIPAWRASRVQPVEALRSRT
jgi:predicted permease